MKTQPRNYVVPFIAVLVIGVAIISMTASVASRATAFAMLPILVVCLGIVVTCGLLDSNKSVRDQSGKFVDTKTVVFHDSQGKPVTVRDIAKKGK